MSPAAIILCFDSRPNDYWVIESHLDIIYDIIAQTSLSGTTIVLLITAAFVAGFIDAVAGGGGLLTVPAMLSTGLSPHVALGTNKLAATFGSMTAAYTFYKNKLFDPVFWQLSFWATCIGALLGTVSVHYLDSAVLNKILPIFIGFSALYTLFNPIKENSNQELPTKNAKLSKKQIIQGSVLGFYDGFAGPGTGAFWTVSNLFLYKINLLLSSGLARAMNFVSNIFSLFAFIYLGHVNFVLGIIMGVFLMAGAYTGAHSAIKLGNRFIRPVFVTVVTIMTLKLGYDAWFY
ncbi:MAG: TSUP family transporter [Gammaproteobacteria bacterium]|nr:TSUP family transporter [Gammaproteobacteria bacterium]